ncbi:hypothetical protein [Microvirga massiliensis]|uniref:hypothetical protein n=1 Tax=Microvirga massiliensis TaxID=1033741 RepID=UPI00062BC128|nr:hypothetical protein [Microvirga massiliensis]
MTAADITLALFALCNTVRVFAYLPHIITVARDPNGASAISCTTWVLFAGSHLATVAYAILNLDDWRMAAVFGANTACCAVILGLAVLKRARFKHGTVLGRQASVHGWDPMLAEHDHEAAMTAYDSPFRPMAC